MARINFILDNIPVPEFNKNLFRKQVRDLLKVFEREENFDPGTVNLKLCDDATIHEHNKTFLKHDYPTDVITFVYEDLPEESDILVSTDSVFTNSVKYKTAFESELLRVVIHGLLHIAGYDDRTETQKKLMTERENFYLNNQL